MSRNKRKAIYLPPSFDRGGSFLLQGCDVFTAAQKSELQKIDIPKKWRANGAAAQWLAGLDAAVNWYDSLPVSNTPASAVRSDVVAIREAASAFRKTIQMANHAARVAIDAEADALALEAHLGLHWRPIRRSDGNRSILADVWELVGDVAKVAEQTAGLIVTDRNQRPGRSRSSLFAWLAASEMSRRSEHQLPTADWVCDLIRTAAEFRGLTLGKETVLKQVKAARLNKGSDRAT